MLKIISYVRLSHRCLSVKIKRCRTVTSYELPEPIRQRCIQVVASLGLVFGGLDLIVTPEGDHIFLECNGGGQWQWLEYETNLPFSATIAEVLMAGKGEEQ